MDVDEPLHLVGWRETWQNHRQAARHHEQIECGNGIMMVKNMFLDGFR
jgi:hypothetical protein